MQSTIILRRSRGFRTNGTKTYVKEIIRCLYFKFKALSSPFKISSGNVICNNGPTYWYACKRLARTVLIFTESSDQLFRATDRVPGLPASPGYAQWRNAAIFLAPHCSDGMCRSASTTPPHVRHRCRNLRVESAGENFTPRLLTEPYVTLSRHTALDHSFDARSKYQWTNSFGYSFLTSVSFRWAFRFESLYLDCIHLSRRDCIALHSR